MIDFIHDQATDTFTGKTSVETYVASATGERATHPDDHPQKNTAVYKLTFQPAAKEGEDPLPAEELLKGREAAVASKAVMHYIATSALVNVKPIAAQHVND